MKHPARPAGRTSTAPAQRVRTSTVLRYATGALSTGGFATLPGLVLLYYMTDVLAVPALAAGLVIGAVKVWDILVDPLIGAVSDLDEQRTGSRRRLMAVGAIVVPACFVLTFAVPAGTPQATAAVWVGIAFLACATAFSCFQVPYIALPASLTVDYDERTRLLTARVVVLTIAIVLFGAGGPALRRLGEDAHAGHLTMALVSAAVLLIAGLVAATSAPRLAPRALAGGARAGARIRAAYRDAVDVLRVGRSLRALIVPFFLQALATGTMLAAAQYVATYVLRSEDAITLLFVALIAPAVVAAPMWQALSRRTSKRFAFQLASVVFAIACVLLVPLLWVPDAWVYAPVALAGIAYAGMQSLPMAMLPDAMAHDRKRSGTDRAGVIGGVWTAVETTGFALGGLVLASILAGTGYVSSAGGAAQSEAVVTGIAIAFALVPAVLVLVSLVPLRGYRLTREVVDADAARIDEGAGT